jgi:hypothetical protein
MASATEQMAKLVEQRGRAAARVGEVEAEQRLAQQTLTGAREALVQFERRGSGRAPERGELEAALAEAQARANEPWAERVEGARRRARDAQHAVQRHAAEHMTELVEAREADGEAAAERINTACTELIAGYAEWQSTAQELGGLLRHLGPVGPGDVSRDRSEALVREATRLLQTGGETGPTVTRDLVAPGEPAVA